MASELPERFHDLPEESFCAARWFTLEITESAILDDPAHAIDNMKRLSALGCRLAIDDYGTGYSSLVIVRSTIDLAHNMGLAVVAEGVEDEAAFDQLRALGCDMAQGYWLTRPLGASDIPAWMRDSAWAQPLVPELKTLRRVV